MTATKIQPGDDTHLTLLMAPHALNFVTGPDRAALLAFGRDVFAAARASQCLAQIEEPALPVAPVLDDRWKARMLDGRAPERDEMGFGNHPELPFLDEGMMPRSFFAALGLELAHTSAEDQLDGDVLGAMSEAVNWSRWMPTAPKGDGWKLVSIFDTEDGPVAWWLRELPEAEDGTTTIRNLQAEVERLKARIARAGAAPAAVAGPAISEIDWDVLPENPGERGRFDRQLTQLYGGDPRVSISTALRLWAETPSSGFFGAQCAVFANEVAKMHIAAPALEAPAAPAPVQIQALHRARRALYAISKTYDDSELRTRALEADEEIDRMLTAAPEAPAAPSEGLESLLNEALAEMKHIAETEQVSLTPTFHNEVRRPHDKRKFHMGDARRAARNAVSALEKAFAVVIASNAAAPAAPAVDAKPLLAPEIELDAVVRDAEQIIRDAEHYRFIKRHRLILSGGTQTFGWPIAPFGDECDRYIAQELAAERAAQAAAKGDGGHE
ncbi:hypothetical protein [Delftia acidovorans]|uniref:Uncharacterized protein n=1 Tax=Delftia acidovorans TaxID=80866 RepID=A0AAJ2R532_DELAC|nr:hypothetical protein [Delftia acidovorans]MDX4957278.1 hypothetical protein [Delftia acidovorans]